MMFFMESVITSSASLWCDIMDNVTRIGVSIEPELLDKFDNMISRKGYATRSEAFRDLIRDALTKSIIEYEAANVCGTITLMYNHHKGDIQEKITDIQHDNHEIISSSIHVHLDSQLCLEVLVVTGTSAEVNSLSNKLESVKGVQSGIPVMMPTDTPKQKSDLHIH